MTLIIRVFQHFLFIRLIWVSINMHIKAIVDINLKSFEKKEVIKIHQKDSFRFV